MKKLSIVFLSALALSAVTEGQARGSFNQLLGAQSSAQRNFLPAQAVASQQTINRSREMQEAADKISNNFTSTAELFALNTEYLEERYRPDFNNGKLNLEQYGNIFNTAAHKFFSSLSQEKELKLTAESLSNHPILSVLKEYARENIEKDGLILARELESLAKDKLEEFALLNYLKVGNDDPFNDANVPNVKEIAAIAVSEVLDELQQNA